MPIAYSLRAATVASPALLPFAPVGISAVALGYTACSPRLTSLLLLVFSPAEYCALCTIGGISTIDGRASVEPGAISDTGRSAGGWGQGDRRSRGDEGRAMNGVGKVECGRLHVALKEAGGLVGWWLGPTEGAEVEQCDERAGQHCGAVCVCACVL
jgi:hypothetical protein